MILEVNILTAVTSHPSVPIINTYRRYLVCCRLQQEALNTHARGGRDEMLDERSDETKMAAPIGKKKFVYLSSFRSD